MMSVYRAGGLFLFVCKPFCLLATDIVAPACCDGDSSSGTPNCDHTSLLQSQFMNELREPMRGGSAREILAALKREEEEAKSKPQTIKLMSSNERSKTGNRRKTYFFGPINIGTPGRSTYVLFDTASTGELVVAAGDCQSKACKSRTKFDQEQSTTARSVPCTSISAEGGDSTVVNFQGGEAEGKCVEDVICFGAFCDRHRFVAAEREEGAAFDHLRADGVLGLKRGPGLVSWLADMGHFSRPRISFFFGGGDSESEVIIGGDSERHFESTLIWAPVLPTSDFWAVNVADLALNNQVQGLCTGGCEARIDTASQDITLPSSILERLVANLGLRADCSNFDAMPRLGFVVAGHILNLEPTDYVEKVTRTNQCVVAFSSLDLPPPQGPTLVLGIPFLSKFSTVLDPAQSQVGFGVAKRTKEELSSPGRPPTSALLVKLSADGQPMQQEDVQSCAGTAIPSAEVEGGGAPLCHDGEDAGADPDLLHVVYACDLKQMVGLQASVASLLASTSEPSRLTVHIIVSNDGAGELASAFGVWFPCLSTRTSNGAIVRLHVVDDKMFEQGMAEVSSSDLALGGALNSAENFARFYMHLLIKNLPIVIYLDADTIVQSDLGQLRTELRESGGTVGFAERSPPETLGYMLKASPGCSHGQIRSDANSKKLFNVGMVVIDLKRWKEQGYAETIEGYVQSHNECSTGLWRGGSQVPMLLALQNKPRDEPDDFAVFDSSWNTVGFGWNTTYYHEDIRNAKVLHWNGAEKPWKASGLYRSTWQPYCDLFSSFLPRSPELRLE